MRRDGVQTLTEPDAQHGLVTTDETIRDSRCKVIPVDTSGGAVTLTLGSQMRNAGRLVVIGVGGLANSPCTITAEGDSLVNGSESHALDASRESVQLVYLHDTDNYGLISRYRGK